ncbi:MAG: bifunctional phosphopantothenoylcysteine decarboxylase/phosphopantothenate--cysteine ligase CoaBC [Chromatiales bacterium]|nr:bifunctional phosphopantothenoylcysteine decarboxylase/phosphopantothenate--cysteine ligase CoaBC [Chromatiales bacterium]
MNTKPKTNVLLGVSGGIAAYKSAELVRRLSELGADVRVVMTHSSQAFISPLTLQAVSGNPVHRDVLDEAAEAAMGHIELARWADLVLIAPATAHFLARLAHGLADDLLSTICLATTAPVAVAPAMNQQMWSAAATQTNVALLRSRGIRVLGPGSGPQACGEVGPGRLLEPQELAVLALSPASGGLLRGRKVLISAGPTREAIDPVRFISNHSSGKMGYALAEVAVHEGASVVLVSGPTNLSNPAGVNRVDIVSAADMHAAVLAEAGAADIFVAAAAVADYTPRVVADTKIKKNDTQLNLTLERTRDVLAEVAALSAPPFTVGFAAETNDVEANAIGKLERKRLNMIAANQVGAGQGFHVDVNALSVFWAGGSTAIPLAPKREIAQALWKLIVERFEATNSSHVSG